VVQGVNNVDDSEAGGEVGKVLEGSDGVAVRGSHLHATNCNPMLPCTHQMLFMTCCKLLMCLIFDLASNNEHLVMAEVPPAELLVCCPWCGCSNWLCVTHLERLHREPLLPQCQHKTHRQRGFPHATVGPCYHHHLHHRVWVYYLGVVAAAAADTSSRLRQNTQALAAVILRTFYVENVVKRNLRCQ
jgi:hypothetical protein